MKTLVNTFASVVSLTIELSLSIIESLSFGMSSSENNLEHLGSFTKNLEAEIEFDLYNREER